MYVSVEGDWGAVDGLSKILRNRYERELETETKIVGDRLKFKATVFSILFLKNKDAEFADECRTAWGGLFKEHRNKHPFVFKTEPYDHQNEGFEEAKDRAFYALFWEMGLGKTKTALDIAAWKYYMHRIDAILVVTLNGVHRNWIRKEAPIHFPFDYEGAFWNPTRVEHGMRGLIESKKFAVATINFDSVHTKNGEKFCRRFLTQRRVMMMVDESHCIKTPSARRTRAIIKLGRSAVARLIMTGTPVANSPLDIFKQFEFLSPSILREKNYTEFKRRYAIMQDVPHAGEYHARDATGKLLFDATGAPVMTPIQEIVGYRDIEKITQLIAPYSSRKTKKDCLNLPPKVYRRHTYVLPQQMRAAYTQMVRDMKMDLADGRVSTAKIALTKLLKLQQLVCGFIVPDDLDPFSDEIRGEAFPGGNPRMDALMDVLEEVQGKAIIWATYRFSIIDIEKHIAAKYGANSVATFSGMTSDNDRDKVEDMFQDTTSSLRFMVAQPQAGGTGRTFTAANDVIYWNNSYNLIHRLQSEDRAHRIGQTGTVTYTDLEADESVDGKVIESLIKKVDIAAQITGDDLVEWLS
jgi:hypothetical protein